MIGTENRVTRAIDRVQAKLDDLDAGKAANLDREMDVTFEEHFRFQEMQAHAHAAGQLTTDEAMVCYVALGEVGSPDNGGWAADTGTATKVAVTLLMGELLARKVGR